MTTLLGTAGKLAETHEEHKVQWKIADFLWLSQNKGCYYVSPTFSFANSFWNLEIYAGGCGKGLGGFISVFLQIKDATSPRTVECKLGIKKADGTVEEINEFSHTFESGDFGYQKFFDRSELLRRRSELLPSDTLTIVCIVKHGTDDTIEVPAIPLNLVELETLSRNFKDLFTNEESCDMVLKVGDKKFLTHKSVLVARSRVFAAMFRHDTSENEEGVVTIDDCDPNSFGDFLEYLYSGRIESLSFQSVFHLYSTSDKYDVRELKTFCIDYMKKALTETNVCDVVTLADLHEEEELLSTAQNFFNENLSKIVVTDEWFALLTKNPRLANKLIVEMSSTVNAKNSTA